MFSSRLAALLAGSLILVAAAPVAATSTSVPESFSVAQAITITGTPAAISYGSNLVPGTTTSDVFVDAHVQSNANWTLSLTGTNFTGPATIAAANRQVRTDPTGGYSVSDPTTAITLASGSPTADQATPAYLRLLLPSNAAPGSYSGSVTFTVTGS